ncbi:MAG TPA: hypothetical protein PLV93_14030, partial [Microthrixaceae bacterium]|nr:hypothetical protein [Microthrixaceae bacterium]
MRRHAVVLSALGTVAVAALIGAGCSAPGGGTPTTTTVPTGPRAEVEPNGDVSSATLIATDLSGVSGTGVVASDTDADTFAFDLGSWRGVEAVVSGRDDGVCDPATPAPDVQLLDNDQRVIGYKTSGPDGCSRISPLSESAAGAFPVGRQYVRVLPPVAGDPAGAGVRGAEVAGLTGGGAYSLSISTLDPVDEAEPNDSLSQATPFPVDPQRFSHQIDGQIDDFTESPPSAPDYYALDLPDLVVADASVYAPEFDAGCNSTAEGNWMSLQLLDAAGNIVSSSSDGSGCPSLFWPMYQPAGRYYLRVDGSSTGRRYRIELRVASESSGTETEPNDTATTATPVITS